MNNENTEHSWVRVVGSSDPTKPAVTIECSCKAKPSARTMAAAITAFDDHIHQERRWHVTPPPAVEAPCAHESWVDLGGSRRCADCRESLGKLLKNVRVEPDLMHKWRDDGERPAIVAFKIGENLGVEKPGTAIGLTQTINRLAKLVRVVVDETPGTRSWADATCELRKAVKRG